MVTATAAQAAELADVLVRAAGETIVVLDLGTNSFLGEDYVQWRPSRIAAAQGVSCQVRVLGALASGTLGLSEEALLISRDDLSRFLDGWSPYELSLIDVQGKPSLERIDEIALAIGTAAHGQPLLPSLPGSRLRYSGHDDCYLAVESADRTVPVALLGRLLALLAASALPGATHADVQEPAAECAAALINESSHWIGVPAAASEGMVTINLTATEAPWRLGQRLPEHASQSALYDIKHGTWQFCSVPR